MDAKLPDSHEYYYTTALILSLILFHPFSWAVSLHSEAVNSFRFPLD